MATTREPGSEKSLFELCKESPCGNAADWIKADTTLIEGALASNDSSGFELSSQPAKILRIQWFDHYNYAEAVIQMHGDGRKIPFTGTHRFKEVCGRIYVGLAESEYAQDFANKLLLSINKARAGS